MNVLFPIETINRELDYRLILAALWSGNGNRIFVGNYAFIDRLLPYFTNGIYVGKNIFGQVARLEKGKAYRRVKSRGIDVMYLHEEGAVFGGDETDWEREIKSYYNIDLFDEKDLICVWGEWQRVLDQKRANKTLQVKTTGHPKFDIYKTYPEIYQKDVNAIRAEHGNFILVNTNFAWANHGRGISELFSESEFAVDDKEARLRTISNYKDETSKLVAMVVLIHHMALEFPDINFVVRPHPSENHDHYKKIFDRIPNISVVHKGPVGPWILAADLLIHDSSTTSIEAHLSGTPSINYKPIESYFYDFYLPNQMGFKAETEGEVFDLLRDFIQKGFKGVVTGRDMPAKALNLMENLRSDSFELLTEAFNNMKQDYLNEVKEFDIPSPGQIKKTFLKAQLKEQGHVGLNTVLNREDKKQRYAYVKSKFPGFDRVFLEEKIAILEQRLNKKISMRYYNDRLFEIN